MLSRDLDFPVTVLITGGAAAIAFGVARSTEDIDFEVKVETPKSRQQMAMEELQKKLSTVEKKTGIAAQFSEDIDRWSSIALPHKRSYLLWQLGLVQVRLLDPMVWAVGKLARFHTSDERDVVTVFKKRHPSALSVARTWGQALKKSPASNVQSLFRNNVQTFFKRHASNIWGKRSDPEQLFAVFLKSAQKPGTR